MAIEFPTRPQSLRHAAKPGHETSDAQAGWIFGIVAFLAVAGFMIQLILVGVMHGLNARRTPSDSWPRSTRAQRQSSSPAGFPRLQVAPAVDLAALRSNEEAQLNSYGWIDRKAGIVRLPIGRAMELLAEQGLPARAGTNQVKAGPSSWELLQQRPLHRENETGGAR